MTSDQRKLAKSLFLDTLKRDPNVSLACDRAHISRQTAYQWKEKDEKFAEGWKDAVERTKDVARSALYQRGILGWDETVVSMGQVVYEMEPVLDDKGNQVYEKGKPKMRRGSPMLQHKWSDSLAALYAKANLPEYKEKQPEIDLNVQINMMAEQAKNELLADLAAAMTDEDQATTHPS